MFSTTSSQVDRQTCQMLARFTLNKGKHLLDSTPLYAGKGRVNLGVILYRIKNYMQLLISLVTMSKKV